MNIQITNLLNIVHNLAQHTKIPVHGLLLELGLLPSQVENLHAYLPWEYYQKALDLALAKTGKPHFGLAIGFNAHPLIMGQELGLFIQVCPDFKTAVQEFCRHSAIMGEISTFQYCERAQELAIRYKGMTAWRLASFPAYRCGMEIYAATVVTLSRLLTQNNVRILRIEFDYPKTGDLETAYRQAFGDRIRIEFGCSHSGVVFSGESRHIRNPFFEEALFQQIKNNLEVRLNSFRNAVPLCDSIKVLLEETYYQPRQKELHLDTVARQFNHTTRQLQRELKTGNRSFHDLRNEVKTRLADKFLLYKTNQELADLLKFADVPAFIKWFKTQFEVPPDHLRRARKG